MYQQLKKGGKEERHLIVLPEEAESTGNAFRLQQVEHPRNCATVLRFFQICHRLIVRKGIQYNAKISAHQRNQF